MYSLVSAPVLGFDLARLQGGSAAAEVLLRGLALTAADLDVLASAGRLDTWLRAELWQDVDIAARRMRSIRDLPAGSVDPAMSTRLSGVTEVTQSNAGPDDAGADTPPADAAANALVRALTVVERAPIGNLDGLLHCARHDLLSWTWYDTGKVLAQSETASRATAVLCDALAAAYLRDHLPKTTRRRLAAGWLTAARELVVRPLDLGPHQDALHGLMRRLRTASPTDLQRLRRAADATRRGIGDWAPAVHSASWGVYLSNRLRPAAAAQLLLVQAVEDAGIPVPDRAAGVWNLLSGAVQAIVVRDLLDAQTRHRLLDPYLAALGTAGLS
jgi:hypothetical protein